MSDKKNYFLFQSGQTFGPYPFEDLKKMHENGELAQYDLYWDMSTTHWKPLSELAQQFTPSKSSLPETSFPPAPSEEEIQLIKRSQNPDRPSAPPTMKKQTKMPPPISTLMFDDASISQGSLLKITKNRCFIQSPTDTKRPAFVIGQNLKINFLSEVTLNFFNSEVKLHDIQFDGQYWISELHWVNEKPLELLEDLKE